MSYSVKVTGVGCDLGCVYCYESNMRMKTNNEVAYDLDSIFKTMEERKDADGIGTPTLHGGDPLMIPKPDVEKLLAKMYELHGASGVQTHGVTIDDDHIEMFKKYKTHVGISIDGPWPLNKLRVAGNGRSTKETTERTLRNIRRLRDEGISVGIICVLHRANALPEPRKRLKEWLLELKEIGINGGRLNLCIIDDPILKAKQELTEEEAADAYRDLAEFTLIEHDGLFWQPFRDVVDNLLGNGLGTCIFHPCSYYQADGERVIMGDGSLANCLKTAKTGYAYLREPDQQKDYARYNILPQIPYEDGGCKGCRYWRICYGVCPAEGIDGDWRNRSRFCKAYYAVYEVAEKALKRLLPNVRLVTEQPQIGDWFNDYRLRASAKPAIDPFELLTPQGTTNPSSWKGSAYAGRRNKQQQQRSGCGPGCGCGNRIVIQQHGDIPHGDHSDQEGRR